MKKINYLELGGTLFIPATHKNLELVSACVKYPNLKSLLIDTEDSIAQDELPLALEKIKSLLQTYKKSKLTLFIRPRNVEVLKEILLFEGVRKIDGFILPKFSLSNAKEYFQALETYEFSLMPSVEGSELFNHGELHKLKEVMLTNADRITLVRYGLEDTLKVLRVKRGCADSVFDFAATSSVIGNFIATFKSVGFGVSGGVYPCFSDEDGFVKDVKRDLREGLFSKTIIHPSQIDAINELYKVTQEEFDEAMEIRESKEAVFNLNGKMAETTTMTPYAKEVMKRAEIYGIKESL